MKKRIEIIFIFIFLVLFSLLTIYPVLNILGVSIRSDNAFNTRSLSIVQFSESYEDQNKNGKWDDAEKFTDTNNIPLEEIIGNVKEKRRSIQPN